MNLFSEYDH